MWAIATVSKENMGMGPMVDVANISKDNSGNFLPIFKTLENAGCYLNKLKDNGNKVIVELQVNCEDYDGYKNIT
jgi:hypothetical protein